MERFRGRSEVRQSHGSARVGDCTDLSVPASTGLLTLRPLSTVEGATLSAIIDSHRVERTTHYVVANTGEVTDATAANQDDRVLLEIVTFPRDVGGHFLLV